MNASWPCSGDAEKVGQDGKTAVLKIGNQEVDGVEQKLAKPFAVLQKMAPSRDPEAMETDAEEASIAGGGLVVRAVLYSKYVFKNRPRNVHMY